MASVSMPSSRAVMCHYLVKIGTLFYCNTKVLCVHSQMYLGVYFKGNKQMLMDSAMKCVYVYMYVYCVCVYVYVYVYV